MKLNPLGILFTFLTLVGCPAAVVVVVFKVRPSTQRVVLHDARADVVTLFSLLIPIDNVVSLNVHDKRPVHRVHVAELRVLLYPNSSPGDVSQVVKPNVLQAGHLIDNQGIVVEEIAAADDAEVGEECAQAGKARDAKQQQIVGDDGQLGEAEGVEDLLVDVVGLVIDEEDLQVAFHHRAVLQPP